MIVGLPSTPLAVQSHGLIMNSYCCCVVSNSLNAIKKLYKQYCQWYLSKILQQATNFPRTLVRMCARVFVLSPVHVNRNYTDREIGPIGTSGNSIKLVWRSSWTAIIRGAWQYRVDGPADGTMVPIGRTLSKYVSLPHVYAEQWSSASMWLTVGVR